ncbi:hypothetical protein CMO92_01755 [Candidatus Woesearchaeota archaeon]|nr:hypothetical protein [Candidatus Woesearchaeota archaeon]
MVFEQIFKPTFLEKKPKVSFLIGMFYATIGIISAMIVFPQSVGLVSIAFTSVLVLPTLNRLLTIETRQMVQAKRTTITQIYRNHQDIFQTYIFLFLGIMITYSIFSLILDELTVANVFKSQLRLVGVTGEASNLLFPDFFGILLNNMKVLLVSFVFSLVYGAGAIFFLTWNASVWGTIFGYIAKQAAQVSHESVPLAFLNLFIQVFPHTVVEVSSYLLAIIGGGILSKAVLKEKLGSKRFQRVMYDGFIIFTIAIVLVILGAYIEVFLFPEFI